MVPWWFLVKLPSFLVNQPSLMVPGKASILPGKPTFPEGWDGKESAYKAGDPGSIPGLGRSPEEGNDYRLQSSCWKNSMDRGAWWATVLGTSKSWTRLSDYAFNRLSSKKNLLANAGDVGLVPELGRSPGEGNGNPLQDSCLGNLMDRRAWRATVHAVPKELDTT